MGSYVNRKMKGLQMPNLELFMLGFIVIVAGVGVGWFIYDSRREDDE